MDNPSDSDGSADMDTSSDASSVHEDELASQPASDALVAQPTVNELDIQPVGNELVAHPKRKLDDVVDDPVLVKRSKTDATDQSSFGKLPDAVVQRIFMSLPPAMLFRCTRVCRRFAFVLTQISGNTIRPAKRRFDRHNPEPATQLVDSEVIWVCSRRHTYPFLPKPLNDFSERDMLCLLTQTICENCDMRFPRIGATTNLNGGPGNAGIRTVFPFRITVCGSCLLQLSITDVGLLQERSALPSGALRRGLPYAFITRDLHIVSDKTARSNVNAGINKIFWRKDLELLKASFAEAEILGAGAAEEWTKGLDDVGKKAMSDITRWSHWEETLPLGTEFAALLKEHDISTFAAPSLSRSLLAAPQSQRPGGGLSSSQAIPHLSRPVTAAASNPMQLSRQAMAPDLMDLIQPPAAPAPFTGMHSHAPTALPTHAALPVRSTNVPYELHEMFKLRTADIQSRCQQLSPPIGPDVLKFVGAYNAAIQINTPMTDVEWDHLRPRIEQGREEAERLREETERLDWERAQQMAIIQAAMPTTNYNDMVAAEKAADKEWEAARAPLRKQLGEIADNEINKNWIRGQLNQRTAPVFAKEVLKHTYQQYYLDCNATDPTTVSLVLDDMRWIYETKIKPPAEKLCKELFFCRECFADNQHRWFAFEGLIQHCGAKHTSDFSQGNIVVHWQSAPWPDNPPFLLDLSQVDSRLYPRRNSFTSHRATARPHSRGGGSSPGPRPLSRGGPYRPGSRNGSFQYEYRRSEHLNGSKEYRERGQTQLLNDMPPFATRSPTDPPDVPISDEVHVAKLSGDLAEIWNGMAGVNGLEDSMRVQTALQVAKARYERYFQTYLPIEMFTKVLAIIPALAELKVANKLACRFCDPTFEATHMPFYERLAKKTLFGLPTLLNHFKLNHMSTLQNLSMWSNLIDLPDKEQVQALLKTPGMDDKKLYYVAEAFPGVFPIPLPRIGTVPAPAPDSGLASRLVDRSLGGKTKSKKKKGGNTDAAKAGEYDPRNPSLPSKQEDKAKAPLDLSKFDTDTFPPASTATAPHSNDPFAISADTLAAISRLQSGHASVAPETRAAVDALQTYVPPATEHAPPERLPSPYASRASVPAPAKSATVPDISAIIATLSQQHPPARTPPRAGFTLYTPGSAEHTAALTVSHHQNDERYAPPAAYQSLGTTPAPYQSFGATPAPYQSLGATRAPYQALDATPAPYQALGTSSWQPSPLGQSQYYTPAYESAPEPVGGQDLLAALNNNRAAFQQHDVADYYSQARAQLAQYTREPSHHDTFQQYSTPQPPAPVQYAQTPSYPAQYAQHGYYEQTPQPTISDQPVMMTEILQADGSKFLVDQYGRRFYQA